MPVIEIIAEIGDDPEAARKAGCTASAKLVYTSSHVSEDVSWSYNYFQLSAEGKRGWEFSRFVWVKSFSDGRSKEYDALRNPYPENGMHFSSLMEGSMTGDGWSDSEYVMSCKAYFWKRPGTGLILRNDAGLILHGAAGTILYDD